MSPARLCMMCNAPLNKNGDCETTDCIYNPGAEGEVHENEFDYVEGKGGDTPTDENLPDWGGEGDLSPEELQELLNDSDEDEELTPGEIDELASEGKGERDGQKVEQEAEKPKKDKLD